ALVEERVVGAQQVEHAAIFPQLIFDEELGLLLEGLAQVVVEIRERIGVGLDRVHVANEEPLAEEIRDERVRLRIRQHPAHLALERGRVLQLAAFRRGQQRLVWNAAPQEERQPRRELEVADAVDRAARRTGRILFDAEEEGRRDENALDAGLNAAIEAALRA